MAVLVADSQRPIQLGCHLSVAALCGSRCCCNYYDSPYNPEAFGRTPNVPLCSYSTPTKFHLNPPSPLIKEIGLNP